MRTNGAGSFNPSRSPAAARRVPIRPRARAAAARTSAYSRHWLAARALGRNGTRRAAAGLRGALSDPAPFVRTAAAHALGRIGDRDAFDALVRQAAEDAYDPAQAAAQALAGIDPLRAMQLGGGERASAHLAEAAALAQLELA